LRFAAGDGKFINDYCEARQVGSPSLHDFDALVANMVRS